MHLDRTNNYASSTHRVLLGSRLVLSQVVVQPALFLQFLVRLVLLFVSLHDLAISTADYDLLGHWVPRPLRRADCHIARTSLRLR